MAGDAVVQPSGHSTGSGPRPPTDVRLIDRLLTLLLQGMPLIFGFGFIAPLTTQLLERALPEAAGAQWPLLAGLAIGGAWGAIANLRGRWL
jgi:hypothetical protein